MPPVPTPNKSEPNYGLIILAFCVALMLIFGFVYNPVDRWNQNGAKAPEDLYQNGIAESPSTSGDKQLTADDISTDLEPSDNTPFDQPTLAAIEAWPLSASQVITFKTDTATPTSVAESESVYAYLRQYSLDHPSATFTLEGFYGVPEATTESLYQFRIDYLSSQLAEKGLDLTKFIKEPLTASAGSLLIEDQVFIRREPFANE